MKIPDFKSGDIVQLKQPSKGRWFTGRVSKINKTEATVTLPSGYFVVLKLDDLESAKLIEKQDEESEIEEN